MEYNLREEYSNFKKLLEMPMNDAKYISEHRFPVPRLVQCSPGQGDERLLKARLNTQTPGLESQTFMSDVMSLSVFLQKLKEFVLK